MDEPAFLSKPIKEMTPAELLQAFRWIEERTRAARLAQQPPPPNRGTSAERDC